MKAIVIGLGSMGRRRIRLLKSIDKSVHIIGVDMQEERRNQVGEEFGIDTRRTVLEVCDEHQPDVAFVSTSPLSHNSIISECLDNNLHVFTEINLSSNGYEENIIKAKKKNKVLFLSSTYLYREEIEYIKNSVEECHCKLSYIYHVGQYLPDWHPWESYKDFFVGDKRTNGCREIMAIDFPWLIDVFGEIESFSSENNKNSTLEIDYPDVYQIILRHKSGHIGMITIDVVSRKAIRKFEAFGENLYITWGGTPDSLCDYDFIKKEDVSISLYENVEMVEGYSSFVVENAYKSEIINFLKVISGDEGPRYSFEKDKSILSLIDRIEHEEV